MNESPTQQLIERSRVALAASRQRASAADPRVPGSILNLASVCREPVWWLVIDQRDELARLVPVDLNPLTGAQDVRLSAWSSARDGERSAWTARPAWSVRVPSRLVDAAMVVDALPDGSEDLLEQLAASQSRRHELDEAGEALQEWLEGTISPAARTLEQWANEVDQRSDTRAAAQVETRRPARKSRWLLAAGFLVAVGFGAVQQVRMMQLQQQFSESSSTRPAADAQPSGEVTAVLLAPYQAERGGSPRLTRPHREDSWMVFSLEVPLSFEKGSARFLRGRSEEPVVFVDDLTASDTGEVNLIVPSPRLEPGDYRVQLVDETGAVAIDYRFRLDV